MNDKLYSVRITFTDSAKEYSPQFQTSAEQAEFWKSVLQKAHSRSIVTCLCGGPGDRRLAIRYLSGSDKFTLSKYPHTGPEHALTCGFYSPDHNKSGLGAYSLGVV